MTLDGVEVPPAAFAGTKYLVQGRVLAQSETSESWERVWPTPPVRVQPAAPPADLPREPGSAAEDRQRARAGGRHAARPGRG